MEIFMLKDCWTDDLENGTIEDFSIHSSDYYKMTMANNNRTDPDIIRQIKNREDPKLKPYMVVNLPDNTSDWMLIEDCEDWTDEYDQPTFNSQLNETLYYIVNGKIFEFTPTFSMLEGGLTFINLDK